MSRVRRGVALTPMETRRDVILRAAELAEELGYEVFSLAEGWSLDSTVMLAEVAARTSRITLVAGVLSVWGRTAGTLAMSAATLHQLSGGRFVLGLGASTRRLVEGFHGIRYAHPADRLRQVTTDVRALLAGEPVRSLPSAYPVRLAGRPNGRVPIWIAATGARTVRIAADLADGWYPIMLGRDRCRDWAAELGVPVAAGPFAVVDPDPAAARATAAACLAMYLTSMGEIYPDLVAGQGFQAELDLVRAANPPSARRPGVVPDEAQRLLEEFTAYGTETRVRDELQKWDAVTDITTIGLPPGQPWPAIEATLRAAAP